ncbi:MAG: hypothetical protein JWN44_6531 [Myxococcales bacterium]|nr:hypothetical protein [Myxococcales bacterium]
MALPIDKILAGAPSVKKDGNSYVIPEETDLTVFIALGQEVLQIPRLMKIELSSEVAFHTHKGERFYFSVDQVVGFRFGAVEAKNRHAGAGFFKA